MLFNILQIVEYGLLVVCAMSLSYLVFLTVLALLAPHIPVSPTISLRRRFAIVIPAHNEELVIARTVKSLFAVDYPADLLNVVVIADNCTDATASIAASCGAEVLVRTDPERKSKGHALAWGFSTLLDKESGYDAFVVVDADSVVTPPFLRVMHDALDRGAQAVQATDIVEPQPGTWSPEVSRIALLLYNYIRPLGRRVIGCSAGLRGNGMCFTTDLLRKTPWNAFSLAEDLEFGLHLLLNGTTVHFAPDAVVFATMPKDAQIAASQRARWEGGRWPVVRRFAAPLFLRTLRKRSWLALDALIDLLTPPFVNMVAIALSLVWMRLVIALLGYPINMLLLMCWTVVLTLGALHVGLGLWAANADQLLFRTIMYFPRYVFWKFMLYARAIVTPPQREWTRTTRERTAPRDSR